jgi:DNA-binding transcriptional ArsR family regulator
MEAVDGHAHTLQSVGMGSVGARTLKPTLWRTCRALANVRRLAILRYLLGVSERTVSEVAREMKLPMEVASQYLRSLNARGLLRARRVDRYVMYSARPDEVVPESARLLSALREVMVRQKRRLKMVRRDVTAYTHPRRAQIVCVLGRDRLNFTALHVRTGISRPALLRHLVKLMKRKVVIRRGSRYHCPRPGHRLARTLLQLAQQSG